MKSLSDLETCCGQGGLAAVEQSGNTAAQKKHRPVTSRGCAGLPRRLYVYITPSAGWASKTTARPANRHGLAQCCVNALGGGGRRGKMWLRWWLEERWRKCGG